ncbi:glycosyltransferase family 2 protein [Pedobacter sp. GR22-10]|uniref:glycosyltransferase family 2 protein n=1 Tax=Pedobacter sp. GR22-10 TaxID=2994472 RepID=UPI002245D534|nr:glycosyltransferase [Pedobacter sp. GR22-10]MCX2432360.1 glycosyltransferase [Pedobacter sp. GR22-10]
MNKLKVSVVMITYGHERYILDAINGVLNQNINFEIELIISNDCSPDATDEIIKNFINNSPKGHMIRYYSQPNNVGVLPNFIHALKMAKGEYVALCEGDDFWIDMNKLTMQVNFLDENLKYVGCFHNTEERYEDSSELASFLMNDFPKAREISFKDLTDANVMATCSVLFRNFDFDTLPSWFKKQRMGDWSLHLLNARNGNFYFLPKVLAVHRLHQGSTWMLQDHKKNLQYVVDTYNCMIASESFSLKQKKLLQRSKRKFTTLHYLTIPIKRFVKSILKL